MNWIVREYGEQIIMISVLMLIMIFLGGCGSNGNSGVDGDDGQPCAVEHLEDGVYISCPDSDTFIPTDLWESDEDIDENDERIYKCKRGEGHKKHDHTGHEHCDDE